MCNSIFQVNYQLFTLTPSLFLQPIVTGVVDVPLIDFIPSPITVVQLRSTVPPNDPSMHPNFIASLYTSEDVQLRHMDVPLRMVSWAALLHWSNGFNSPSYCVFVLPSGSAGASQPAMMGPVAVGTDDDARAEGVVAGPVGPSTHTATAPNGASTEGDGAMAGDAATVAAALAAAAGAGGAGAGVVTHTESPAVHHG